MAVDTPRPKDAPRKTWRGGQAPSRVVPTEPTQAQLKAGWMAMRGLSPTEYPAAVYRAMIAAAPDVEEAAAPAPQPYWGGFGPG